MPRAFALALLGLFCFVLTHVLGADGLAASPAPRPYSVRLIADAAPDAYSAEFQDAQGLHVTLSAIHVDRAALYGKPERRDIAAVVGPALPSPLNAENLIVPLSVPVAALQTGMQRLTLRLDPGVLTNPASGALPTEIVDLPVDVYLPNRKTDARLEHRLEGATVYPLGQVTMHCDPNVRPSSIAVSFATPSFSVHAGRALHITRIERHDGSAALLYAGFAQSNSWETDYQYKAIDPLLVSFDVQRDEPNGNIGVGPISIPLSMLHGDIASDAVRIQSGNIQDSIRDQISRGGCRSITLDAADDWDLGLLLERDPPSSPVEDPGNVHLGMTHNAVAFTLGYPSVFETRKQLDRQAVWSYARLAPSGSTVMFRNDRVVQYDPPGQLP